MVSTTTAAELQRAVLLRADELEEITSELRGQLAPSRGSLHAALTLTGSMPTVLREVVRREMSAITDPDLQSQILESLLRHLNSVLDFVETHLSHGTRRQLSEALVEEIRGELDDLGVGDHRVVVSHGGAHNFETVFGDLSHRLFRPLALPSSAIPPPANFALFRVPRLEGAAVQWRPILLGHEVAHVAVAAKNAVAAFDLGTKFDPAVAGALPNPRVRPGAPATLVARGLYQIAECWATELICDLQALHRFGPAAIAAIAEYFTCIGAMEQPSETHPPGSLRVRLLLELIGPVADRRLNSIVAPWADATAAQISVAEPWAQYLAELFGAHLPALSGAAALLGTAGYDFAARQGSIHDAADRLTAGLPGREIVATEGHLDVLVRADVVNAAWLARVEGAATPYDRLAEKTSESIDFVVNWLTSGGQIPVELHQRCDDPAAVLAGESQMSILSEDALLARMQLDHPEKGFVVTPALHRPKGTGLDLRLGTRFIVFRRTAIASFDPLDEHDDPRAIQVFVELSQKERFVLHPQEVILGATLEYLGIPNDLSGQVITRSSYGRLGLLSATAVQVHPGFRGCLTLELVNLSTIPITLTPGERIAQLILWKSAPVASSTDKYTHPIGPQFSRVRSDTEADTLRTLRS
ncbi:Probable dCTP deaminase/DeoxyUTP pyrophosphatase [Mycobacteroides abscessus subsp. massiliense]|nr:Probable dCTP deaminase/DeoxyUTP pyrophosphatase [Mycobacteroides abscessus subsp. massiliense]SKH38802.1 Probable dCTP deaminase/DeoxyUTP pyrophosphatase [Mycobacteroides abscessus subsp. massiliense]SKI31288.1 Probable dCTP deaminase/DeoxyUTP pyrophosphatase [Mycobacteroides abscessus subsp. massiliense]SKJ17043.1 Probable dCTP deaminase/DeoxyUTP pyrophosphatase [Mycobacteroides abscessus subsp. massiliense]SKJ90031.1 Probable dCTP deaminase/DeoxyUTP pyrophosphatase [Mycobacteroides absces